MRIKLWPWRRIVQVIVLASLFAFPLLSRYSHYLYARQTDKLIEQWTGQFQGTLLKATDAAIRVGIPDGEGGVPTRRPRKAILERSKDFYGSAWSARVFGITMTDLLAGAESAFASKSFTRVLLAGLVLPLILTILLGRVFCSWICPAGFLFELGAKVRKLIQFLEIRPLNVKLWRGNKYALLGAGLFFSLLCSLPLLYYIYPPAILSREAHSFVMALFDQAESGALGFALVGLSGASFFLLCLVLFEIAVAPGAWCKSICPGGALYSLLGRYRLVRVRRNVDTCTHCSECVRICPRGLAPMSDLTGMECDSCGLCVDVCEPHSLRFKVSLSDECFPGRGKTVPDTSSSDVPPPAGKGAKPPPVTVSVLLLLALGFVFTGTAFAHHIMGIPHYSYDKDYPQAPVLKLVEDVGEWEFQLTGYPGNPQPGTRTQLNVYVADKTTRALYHKPLTMRIYLQSAFGQKKLVYGPEQTALDENVFKFYPTYPEEGNYEVTLDVESEKGTSTLHLPMVVGEPGSPWAVLGWSFGGLALFIIVIRAAKIKMSRRAHPVGVPS